MCSPVNGLTTKPGVSFFTFSLGFAASAALASSLGALASSLGFSSPWPAGLSSGPEGLCAAAGIDALRSNVRQTDRTITNQLRGRNNCTSRFTAPSLDPDLPDRPRGRTEVNSITGNIQDKNNCLMLPRNLVNLLSKRRGHISTSCARRVPCAI